MNRLVTTVCLAASLFTATLTPALAQQGHSPFPGPDATESAAWQLVDQRELDIEGELVTLSPDGQWIAGIDPDRHFCVWEVATLEPTCDTEQQPILPESIRWSPDSTAVAYSLDALMQLYDSDLFVFEVESGQSVNLTDDGFADSIPLGEEPGLESLPIDLYPGWTPDGESLVFARTEWIAEQPTTELMVIGREGGEPESFHTVRNDFPWAISSPIFPLADGSVLYSVWVGDSEDPGNGIWHLDADGDATQLVSGVPGEEFPLPALVDVRETDDGFVASGYSRVLANDMPVVGPVAFELDIQSGELTPAGPESEPDRFTTPYRYAPDGVSTIAIESQRAERHLVITGPDGGTLDLGIHEGGRYINARGIDWVANDTILLPNFGNGGILFTVEAGEQPACGCIDPDEPAA